jgi:Ala-tRNA(Pro) deacylase
MHIEQYLANQGVWFETILHRPAYTAEAAVRAMHVLPTEVAKAVLIKADELVVAIVPANAHVDLAAVRQMMDADDVLLIHESELVKYFPDCESGVVPPFGSLYGLATIVDESLAEQADIIFCGNRHREAIRMQYHDFCVLERPKIAAIARADAPEKAAR